jgi:hypothetical protein
MPLAIVPPMGKYVPPAEPVPIRKNVGSCAAATPAVSAVAIAAAVSFVNSPIFYLPEVSIACDLNHAMRLWTVTI